MAFFFVTASKKISEFLVFWLKKEPNISQILLKLWLIGNRTSCCPIRSVIILVLIKQKGLPLRGRPILLITCMITDRIGLHSVLLPLLTRVLFQIFSSDWSKECYIGVCFIDVSLYIYFALYVEGTPMICNQANSPTLLFPTRSVKKSPARSRFLAKGKCILMSSIFHWYGHTTVLNIWTKFCRL